MTTLPEDVLSIETRRLMEEEARLEGEMHAVEASLSGLRDVDLTLTLAAVKLSLCLQLMKRIAAPGNADTRQALETRITGAALGALRLVDGLLAENISEDQKGIIQANPLYAEVRSRLEEFLMAGGGGYMEARQADAHARKLLSRGIVAAIRKYATDADNYPPMELEEYPPFVRTVLLNLFPVMLREKPARPPYGIEEGEEVTYSSRNMKLPLSQAVFYIENELLPELEKRLMADPGSRSLQNEIRDTRERLEDYKKLRFFPRSTPVMLEKGYYTEGITGYTADGEMLVPMPIPVSFRSGTNMDRMMELVRMDVVRRIAGRGVSPEIDKEYRRMRSLESGIRGSSRAASMKLDAAWGYRVLRQDFPFLARLSDKKCFQELMDMAAGAGSAARRIERMMERDEAARPGAAGDLPPPAPESGPAP